MTVALWVLCVLYFLGVAYVVGSCLALMLTVSCMWVVTTLNDSEVSP